MDELYLEGQLCDLGKSRIGMTYQINDIAELKDRQSNHSNTVKLPKTPANRAILDSIENINLNTRTPYRKLDARLKASGNEIVPSGFAQVKNAQDYYEAVIFSGIVSFFDKIKGKSIKELDLSSLNHVWNVTNAMNSRNNTDGYIWAIIDYGAMTDFSDDFPVNKSAPCVFGKTIWDKIFSEAGVSYTCPFLQAAPFTKVLIPCTEMTTVRRKHITVTQTINDLYINRWRPYLGCLGEDVILESYKITFTNLVRGTSIFVMDALSLSSLELEDTFIPVRVIRNDLGISLVNDNSGNPGYFHGFPAATSGPPLFLPTIGGTGHTVTVEADVISNSDDDRTVSFYLRAPFDIYRRAIGGTSLFEGFHVNATLDISGSLPDLKQDEFVKAFMQYYGLIPQPDPYTGEIVLERFQAIKNNIPVAKDWSAKLSLKKEPRISFEFGKYAQVNDMLYDNDDDVVPALGKGTFSIEDETLSPYALLFQSVFSGTDSHKRLSTTPREVSHIPFIDDEGNIDPGSRKPRVLILDYSDMRINYSDGINPSFIFATDLPVTFFYRPGNDQSMDFQTFIKLHYDALMDVLTDVKFVQANLLLQPLDIAELDHFIPVYISFFAHYFYVNKLVNFMEGEETVSELIRL